MTIVLQLTGFLALGGAVGVVSAALGIGGGILMVPVLREFVPGMDPHTAKGTSLFIIIFVAIANSWRLNRGHKDKMLGLAGAAACGSIVGGWSGAWVTLFMSGQVVTIVFIAVMVMLMARLLLVRLPGQDGECPARHRYGLATVFGLFAGIVGGMTGLGGGAVFVPLALMAGMARHDRVTALSNTAMIATAVAGTTAHLFAENIDGMAWTVGQVNLAVAPLVFIGSQLSGAFGKRLNDRVSITQRKVAMAVVILVIVARLTVGLFA